MQILTENNLTAQVLAEVVETREEFAVRRVEYAAECFRQENVYPKEWQLVRRGGGAYYWMGTSRLEESCWLLLD